MGVISEQAKRLSQRLIDTDRARRKAELERDLDLRNMLANASVDLVREADPAELRALVLSWMLQRTRDAELLLEARDALRVALDCADPDDQRPASLGNCDEVLRKLTEATR